MSNKFKGSCLCQEIRFSVSGFADKTANCHCTMCRKFHGAAFGTLVGVKDLIWLTGNHLIKEFVAPNGTTRTFCSHCGSSLGFRVKHAPLEKIELAIATFDDDIPMTIDAQIFTNYKANWHELKPNIPSFGEGRVK